MIKTLPTAVIACVLATCVASSNAEGTPHYGPASAQAMATERSIAQCATQQGVRYEPYLPPHAALDDAINHTADVHITAEQVRRHNAALPTNPNKKHRAAATDATAWDAVVRTCRHQAGAALAATHQAILAQQDKRANSYTEKRALAFTPGQTPPDSTYKAPPPTNEVTTGSVGAGNSPVARYVARHADYRQALTQYRACVNTAGLPANNPDHFNNLYTYGGAPGVPRWMTSSQAVKFIYRAISVTERCNKNLDAATSSALHTLYN